MKRCWIGQEGESKQPAIITGWRSPNRRDCMEGAHACQELFDGRIGGGRTDHHVFVEVAMLGRMRERDEFDHYALPTSRDGRIGTASYRSGPMILRTFLSESAERHHYHGHGHLDKVYEN